MFKIMRGLPEASVRGDIIRVFFTTVLHSGLSTGGQTQVADGESGKDRRSWFSQEVPVPIPQPLAIKFCP